MSRHNGRVYITPLRGRNSRRDARLRRDFSKQNRGKGFCRENVDCVDVLYVVYVGERLDVVEVVECVQVGYDEYVDEWLEVIEEVDYIQVNDVDCVDERLEEVEDLNCVHVEDVDCVAALLMWICNVDMRLRIRKLKLKAKRV